MSSPLFFRLIDTDKFHFFGGKWKWEYKKIFCCGIFEEIVSWTWFVSCGLLGKGNEMKFKFSGSVEAGTAVRIDGVCFENTSDIKIYHFKCKKINQTYFL